MTACELCWDQAFRDSRMLGGSQTDHYHRLLKVNKHHFAEDMYREAIDIIAHLHQKITLEVYDFECYDDGRGAICGHDDGCPTHPVLVCGHCWEIRREIDDEAPVRDEDKYPCETMKTIIFCRERVAS